MASNENSPFYRPKFRSGSRFVNKFGVNPVVGTAWEDIWSVGGSYTGFLTAADTVRIAAGGNAADTAAGAGARSVSIEGLDSNWELASVTLDTNGISASSSSTTSFIRVFRAYVHECGTYGSNNTGAVTVETTGGTTLAEIPAASGQSEMAIYTIPAGHFGYVLGLSVTVDPGNNAANVRLVTRADADVTSAPMSPMRVRSSIVALTGTFQDRTPLGGTRLDAKTDVWIQAQEAGSGSSPEVDAEFNVVLVPYYE